MPSLSSNTSGYGRIKGMLHHNAQSIANGDDLLEIVSGNGMASRPLVRIMADARLTVTRRHRNKASLVA